MCDELPPRIPLSPMGTLYMHWTPSHPSPRLLAALDPLYLYLLAFARGSLPPHPPLPHACSLDPSSLPWTRLFPSCNFWKKAPWPPVSSCSTQNWSGSVLGRASPSSPQADSVAHILILPTIPAVHTMNEAGMSQSTNCLLCFCIAPTTVPTSPSGILLV